jgi:hypothetical protein
MSNCGQVAMLRPELRLMIINHDIGHSSPNTSELRLMIINHDIGHSSTNISPNTRGLWDSPNLV